jgi:hypothetical protein
MSSGIPLDSNFKNLSCQLGGLRLNGKVDYAGVLPAVTGGTAQSYNVVTIDDSEAAQILSKSLSGKFLQVTVGQDVYYLPLYS